MEDLKAEWEKVRHTADTLEGHKFITVSSVPIKDLYTPEDMADIDFETEIGYPGFTPYTRGVHPSMYRRRLWTRRQFSGMGTPEQTNERYHFLLNQGQMGLSVAFDLPTLMGYDSDHARSKGEVGVCGVAVDSLKDMETIFKGIDLGEISTSMTINAPAAIILAFYIVVAEKKGIKPDQLRGTLQNDILKEYIAQKEWIYPPAPSMKLIADTIEFGTREMPLWNTISISGYHIREAGSTAVQELAYTLADGFAYVEAGLARGLDVDEFAPRLSFFFNSHLDFFEEIAKYRAARKIWARHMKEKYGAKDPKSYLMRFHTQTAGVSLTAQQPENNIPRVTWQAMAAALGGTQSLHTNSMDETLALPSEKAALIALRTQQLVAYESGITNTIDPLAGSYFVESLTKQTEDEAEKIFEEIERRGGVLAAIEQGYFQRELAKSAYTYQRAVEKGERVVVGVNKFVMDNAEIEIPLLKIDESVEREQIESLRQLKQARDNDKVQRTLGELKEAAERDDNLMPYFMECARVYATMGEIVDVLRDIYGEYEEPPTI
ncbi:MAG: methylmalonyl-CoA mutase [candidate division Zixibacteria bacterium]|nr:methylmalonyl-CoA mutase [candidate division Zixibacteria bacterium]